MTLPSSDGKERERLRELAEGRAAWHHWGPYVSERGWGTVREDYSDDGDAWRYFTHDHARSRAYRWNEDGLAGISDDEQYLCLSLALWNGRDAILKERIFGLAGPEGNHGEDAKEYWWYLDATPTHSWLRWRYVYPQATFPYLRLVDENARRTRQDPEFELADTGVFDAGYWEITAEYAKADPEDVLLRLTVRNAGRDHATLDLMPQLTFRNTWSWGEDPRRPQIKPAPQGLLAEHLVLGRRVLTLPGTPELIFCDNESNAERLFGTANPDIFPKDSINDYIVRGATVNPNKVGTRVAARYQLTLPSGGSTELRLRLAPDRRDLGDEFTEVMTARQQEADEFHASLVPEGVSPDRALIARSALAGVIWSKQYYHYNVGRWLDGDPAEPPPPAGRLGGRNAGWRHFDAADVLIMPDKWEYPWYAAWDLAFHCIPMAHVDPEFAKNQLVLLLREWYMHPSGQLPAHEWQFSDVNPPMHAWAALRVWEIDGRRDRRFLARVFHKLLLNFTWWVNRKDALGSNVFEGGFLGMDNIAPFDRSAVQPASGLLEQSDGTAWMALYCLTLLELSLTLAAEDPSYEDVAIKFLEHFTLIATSLDEQGLWDEQDGFYYDVLRQNDGTRIPLRARSMVGLLPLCAVAVLPTSLRERLPDFSRRMDWILANRPAVRAVIEHSAAPGENDSYLLSIVSPDRLRRILSRMLDEEEFLSPHGIRSLSRAHLAHPLGFRLGDTTARLDYEPAESTTALFGGNSNWRGPIWWPVNHVLLEALRRYSLHLGDGYLVECPTGSGQKRTLAEVVAEVERRLISLFELTPDGRRPFLGQTPLLLRPGWRDQLQFHEYFHGDTGAGLGASHQTGWTALVADLILRTD
jgi:hypothetical protein